jgi:glycosyltransferase involved in cell wall biosynthesis
MRVLHVYAGNLYGGVESMLATFARQRDLVPEMEPAFALAFDGRLADELRAAGARVDVVGGARLSRPWTVWGARRRLGEVLRARRPDVAVFHSAWSHGIFAPAAKRLRIPAVFWLHDAVSGGAAERLARRAWPAGIVCTSAYVRETLPKLFPAGWAEVIHPAVPSPDVAPHVSERAAVRAELGTSPDAVVIVQASRMEPWKGHRPHLEALGRLRDDPRWTCWMAGGARRPHERVHGDEMRALAESLGIADRVRWLGERSDVPRLLAAADVLCQPNLGPEPFGMTYVEAMYAGLPVVASDLGGAREIVDERTGLRVPTGDVPALADALASLVGDAGMRARLGGAGPARARELCDPARQMRHLAEFLDEITSTDRW